MADSRQSKRTPVTLKIKFKSATLEQFIDRYAVDVSHGGIFIRTKDPLPVGTTMKFEFQLKDATPLIKGEGTVVWTREHDPSRTGVAPGMGVRFDRLADGSREVLDQILARKAGKAPTSSGFTDMPTRVAPSPLVADLARESQSTMQAPGRFPEERETTPLPNPMPFHSDADEFPDEAFEEATKVRSLDDLAALSASADLDLASITAALTDSDDALPDTPISGPIAEQARRRADSEGPTRLIGEPRLPDISGETSAPSGKSDSNERAETVPLDRLDSGAIDPGLDASPGSEIPDDASQRAHDEGSDAEDDEPTRVREDDDERAATSLYVPSDTDTSDDASDTDSDTDADSADALAVAEPTATEPVDELAARRAAKTKADEERAAATPSDADESAAAVAAKLATENATESASSADHSAENSERDKNTAAVASIASATDEVDAKQKSDGGKSGTPWALIALAVVILAVAGGYFVLAGGKSSDEKASQTDKPDKPEKPQTPIAIDAAPPPPIDAAIDAATAKPDAGVPDATVPVADPNAKLVSVQIRSAPSKATVELVGTDQSGTTPHTFELAEGTTHKIRVSMAGFAPKEIDVEAAEKLRVPRVRLEPTPMVMRLTSEPSGALVYVDGRRVKGRTPTTFELPQSFRDKRSFKISMRLPKHQKLDLQVKSDAFTFENDQMLMDVAGTLVPGQSTPRKAPSDSASSDDTKPADTPADTPADKPADPPAAQPVAPNPIEMPKTTQR